MEHLLKIVKGTTDLNYIYKNELDKAGFAHNAVYFDNKNLAKITVSNQKTGSGANVNEALTEVLNTPVIKKFKRRKVYARFKDNNWAFDLAEMGSLSYKDRGVN